MRLIEVASCDNCPFLWSNMEFPETVCKADFFLKNPLRGNLWGMGEHRHGQPIPAACPLKFEGVATAGLVVRNAQ